MVTTVDTLFREALGLSHDSRVVLAERLLESLEPDPAVISAHMEIIRHRLQMLENGSDQPVPGPEGLRNVRETILKRAQA